MLKITNFFVIEKKTNLRLSLITMIFFALNEQRIM